MQNNRQQGIESQDHPPHPPKKLKGEKSDFPTLIHRFNATPIQINLNSFFVVVIHRVSRLSLKVIWKAKVPTRNQDHPQEKEMQKSKMAI